MPSASELERYYGAEAEHTRSRQCWSREEVHYRHYEAIWSEALARIEENSGRGPLLDVGCGGGQFLAFARARGWRELEGVEPSPEAAERARQRAAERAERAKREVELAATAAAQVSPGQSEQPALQL